MVTLPTFKLSQHLRNGRSLNEGRLPLGCMGRGGSTQGHWGLVRVFRGLVRVLWGRGEGYRVAGRGGAGPGADGRRSHAAHCPALPAAGHHRKQWTDNSNLKPTHFLQTHNSSYHSRLRREHGRGLTFFS